MWEDKNGNRRGIPCQEGGSGMGMKKRIFNIITSAAVAAVLVLNVPGAVAAAGSEHCVVPMGDVVGINIKSDGVIVTNVVAIETESGSVSPAADAGMLPGDV